MSIFFKRNKLDNKGFAISGIMYAILVIAILLVLGTLKTLQSRKTIVEKMKNDTIDNLEESLTYSGGSISIEGINTTYKSITISYELSSVSPKANIECFYGRSENDITHSKNVIIDTENKTCTINNLLANTEYYYKISAKSEWHETNIETGNITTNKKSGITIANATGYKKVLRVVYMNPYDLTQECNSSNFVSTTETNRSVCMRWYVYYDDGKNAKLILDHNTTARITFSSTSATPATMISEIEARLAYDTKDWDIHKGDPTKIQEASVITADEVALIAGSSSWTSASSTSSVSFDATTDADTGTTTYSGKYAWLYNYTYNCKTTYSCTTIDNNKYNTYKLDTTDSTNSTFNATGTTGYTYGYWTKNTKYNSSNVWVVDKGSRMYYASVSSAYYGIRPVVTIPSDLISSATPQIVYLDPTDLSASCDASNSVSTTETKTGCMKWYLYSDDGENAKLLLDHNTTARLTSTSSGTTNLLASINARLKNDSVGWQISKGDPTKIQEVTVITADEVASLTGKSWTSASSTAYFYLQGTYSNYQTKPLYKNTTTNAYAWLYNNTYQCKSASTNYGCTIEDNTKTYDTYKYNASTGAFTSTSGTSSNYTTGYWTNSTKSGTTTTLWTIHYYGRLYYDIYSTTTNGIRPVIVVPSSFILEL